MTKKHTAKIEINLESRKLAEAVYRALTPEPDARVKTTVKNNVITISFETDTLATLRALTNSYLRWVIAAKNAINAAETIPEGA